MGAQAPTERRPERKARCGSSAGSCGPRLPGDTHVSELDQALLAQGAEALVGRAGLQEELRQAHGLAPEQGPHGWPARDPAGPDGRRRLRAARARTVSRGGPELGLLLRPGRSPAPWGSGLQQLRPVLPPGPPLQAPPEPPSRPRPLATAGSGSAPPPPLVPAPRRPTNGARSCGRRRRRRRRQTAQTRRQCGGSRNLSGLRRRAATCSAVHSFLKGVLLSLRAIKFTRLEYTIL